MPRGMLPAINQFEYTTINDVVDQTLHSALEVEAARA